VACLSQEKDRACALPVLGGSAGSTFASSLVRPVRARYSAFDDAPVHRARGRRANALTRRFSSAIVVTSEVGEVPTEVGEVVARGGGMICDLTMGFPLVHMELVRLVRKSMCPYIHRKTCIDFFKNSL